MINENNNLDKVIMAIKWPEPSSNLKSRIMNSFEDKPISHKSSFTGFRRVAMVSIIITFSFMLGALTGKYGISNYSTTSSFYTGAGTVLASELFK